MDFIQLEGRNIPVRQFDTLVIGTGCAGFNAADSLYDLGCRNIAVVTEGINMGTSRNTGSDKQTYYKMAVEFNETDSVGSMAKSLFGGKSVNGDTALIEAANSLRSFMKLVNLGVPFPTNEYGEFIGYRTDHDNRKRATSAGPLTSKYMTEALENQVKRKNIPIIDNTVIVELLVDNGQIKGAVGIDKQKLYEESMGFVIFEVKNIIMATGGPAGIYKNSVYPRSQTGMLSLAIDAGAECANLQEWQYGIASVDFRWNLSGTYQQVIPKYISIDETGAEREFLPDYFENSTDAAHYVFMKGYQWPFDSAKLTGSSVIDMIVYHEEVEMGRKVYLDFRSEPSALKNGFDGLSNEAYSYLEKSGALLKIPICRLEKMNQPAIELYRAHGIDLYSEPLRITVAAQHNNGGVAVDSSWETNIKGLYAAGEAAGTFGVYRPGGSALNSTQVGALRAAESIRFGQTENLPLSREELTEKCRIIRFILSRVNPKRKELNSNVSRLRDEFAEKMSAWGAHIRNSRQLIKLERETDEQLLALREMAEHLSPVDLPGWFKLKDMLTTQRAVVRSMIFAGEHIGSRGGSVFCTEKQNLTDAKSIQTIFVQEKEAYADMVLSYSDKSGCSFRAVRPIPAAENWFETVWNKYNQRRGRM